jgi:GNAT superfamily N-acetyltransferase
MTGRQPLQIIEWQEDLAGAFSAINREWIEAMFAIEPADVEVLDDPAGQIIAHGGDILFVTAEGLGVVGAGALKRGADGAVELTKMGVLESARGLKAGEALLAALIARGQAMGAKPLYLLTNRKCEAAIHLYEKLGFVHDAGIMERFGGRYGRADVAMRYAAG